MGGACSGIEWEWHTRAGRVEFACIGEFESWKKTQETYEMGQTASPLDHRAGDEDCAGLPLRSVGVLSPAVSMISLSCCIRFCASSIWR